MRLYFPKKDILDDERPVMLMPEEDRIAFTIASDSLDARAEEMAKDYSHDGTSVSKNDVVSLAKDTYSLTVQLFEYKISRGETLYHEEQAIYDLCKSELQKYSSSDAVNEIEIPQGSESQPVGSIWGALFNAIELVRNCIDQVKDWFNLTSDKDKADRSLVNAGHEILPSYASIIEGFFTTIAEMFLPTLAPTVIGVTEAQAVCAAKFQDNGRTVNKQMAAKMLDIADYAYNGHSESGDFTKLSASEIPQSIRTLYDAQSGLLKSTRGLRVWLGKNGNDIVVSYSGTDVKNFDMVYADIIQLSQPSILYLKAAGLLKILMDNISGKQFYVTGHSLGGGLSQFSVTANMNAYSSRLVGYGYNPAGLSSVAIKHLEDARLNKAKRVMWIFMTCKDPVSAFGGKIGCLTTLPKTDKNGHSMSDLKVCMRKYITTTTPTALSNKNIVWRSHADSDFIPYTRTLSFSSGGSVYPVFNNNASSGASNLISVDIPDALFPYLNFSTSKQSSCLGVYNKYNGTAHTVMNRMLLFSSDEPVVSNNSVGNIHSTIIYGKFGLGTPEFIELLRQAYADSGVASYGSQSAMQKLFAALNNPFEYDKQAWIDGIKIQFGVDMNTVFRQWYLSETYFNTFISNIMADRIDLYQSYNTGTSPDTAAIKRLLSGIKDILVKHLTVLLNAAVRWNAISQNDMNYYMNWIKQFADTVISNV